MNNLTFPLLELEEVLGVKNGKRAGIDKILVEQIKYFGPKMKYSHSDSTTGT